MPARGANGDGRTRLELDSAVYQTESLLQAAHAFGGAVRAWIRQGGEGRSHEVILERGPAAGGRPLALLAAEFMDEAAAQELRRRLAKDNAKLRDYVVTLALLTAGGALPRPPEADGEPKPAAPALSPEEDAEIDRLIREAEAEIERRASEFADAERTRLTWEKSRTDEPPGPDRPTPA